MDKDNMRSKMSLAEARAKKKEIEAVGWVIHIILNDDSNTYSLLRHREGKECNLCK